MKFKVYNKKTNKYENESRYLIDSNGLLFERVNNLHLSPNTDRSNLDIQYIQEG
jgi:hypothetical protein